MSLLPIVNVTNLQFFGERNARERIENDSRSYVNDDFRNLWNSPSNTNEIADIPIKDFPIIVR